MRAKLAAWDSGKPYRAKDWMLWTMSSWVAGGMLLTSMPLRSLIIISSIFFQERRMPTALRSSSASAPEKLPTTMAMRRSCS